MSLDKIKGMYHVSLAFEDNKILVNWILDYYLGEIYNKISSKNLETIYAQYCMVLEIAQWYFENINCENILETIKEKIKKIPDFPKFIEMELKCCDILVPYLEKHYKKNYNYFINWAYFVDDIIGIPDLVYSIFGSGSSIDKYQIVLFKTYKRMTKKLKYRAELELTAYYWLLLKNRVSLTTKHNIILVQNNKVKEITVEIDGEKLYAWITAIQSYKKRL